MTFKLTPKMRSALSAYDMAAHRDIDYLVQAHCRALSERWKQDMRLLLVAGVLAFGAVVLVLFALDWSMTAKFAAVVLYLITLLTLLCAASRNNIVGSAKAWAHADLQPLFPLEREVIDALALLYPEFAQILNRAMYAAGIAHLSKVDFRVLKPVFLEMGRHAGLPDLRRLASTAHCGVYASTRTAHSAAPAAAVTTIPQIQSLLMEASVEPVQPALATEVFDAINASASTDALAVLAADPSQDAETRNRCLVVLARRGVHLPPGPRRLEEALD